MSFYLAHPADTTSHQTVSPAVQDRGLSLFKAKPCEVQVVIIPHVIQLGYTSYLKSLPAFMEATIRNEIVPICNRGYPIVTVPYQFPMALPNLIYNFDKAPTNLVIESLKKHSTMIAGKGKTCSFVMRDVTLEKIKNLVDTNPSLNMKTRHIIGTVNLDAMKSVLVVRKILSAFLLTHTYPAFRHDSDVAPAGMDLFEVVTKRRKVSTTSYIACMTDLNRHTESLPENVDMSDNTPKPPKTTEIKLRFAKPSPISEYRWGPVTSLPNSSGVYVPFVKDLAIADITTVPGLMNTTFVRSFASSTSGMFSQLEKFSSAWGVIATTAAGHEISHMCKCIEIAITAQCFVYPVYANDIYEGTVICGAGYSMSIQGESIPVLSYPDLQKMVRDKSAHSCAVTEIIGAVGDEHTEFIRECDSMRKLSKFVKGILLDDIARTWILKTALHLCYTNKYWSTSVSNIRDMLRYLKDPDETIPDDVPMHPKFLFSNDRVEEILCAFGHQAPTFMIPNGKKCVLTGDPPLNFHVRTTTVETAVLDMKYVIENGYVSNNMNNLSSKHRDQPLKSVDKTETWSALKNVYDSNKTEDDSGVKNVVVPETEESTEDNLW